MDFEADTICLQKELYKKVGLYHFLGKYARHSNKPLCKTSNMVRRALMFLQMVVRFRRKNPWGKLYKGSNWASISPRFAKYLVDNEDKIKKIFRRTHCADEIYKQTLAKWGGFKISPLGHLRYIDWNRGTKQSPYTFHSSDIEALKSRTEFFARKFSSNMFNASILISDKLN